MKLKELHNIMSAYPDTELMPILFVGHGSPMNAIEQNEFNNVWIKMSEYLPSPLAIVDRKSVV